MLFYNSVSLDIILFNDFERTADAINTTYLWSAKGNVFFPLTL